MTRHLAVVTAGLSTPSSTRLLSDRLAVAVTRALEAAGETVVVDVVELPPLAHALADHLLTGFPSGGNSTLVYFMCDDCAVEQGRVKGAGGRVEKPKMSIGQYGFISLVVDTEGNMIGLHSQK